MRSRQPPQNVFGLAAIVFENDRIPASNIAGVTTSGVIRTSPWNKVFLL